MPPIDRRKVPDSRSRARPEGFTSGEREEGAGLSPWLDDFAWDPAGTSSDADRLRFRAGALLVLGTLFLVPFALAPDWPLRVVALFLGLVALYHWGRAARFLARRAKFGPSRLRFARFPFGLGEEVTVYLQDVDRLKGARSVTATLVHVAEEREWRGKTAGWVWIRYADFAEVRTLQPGELPFGPGSPARLFALGRTTWPGAELPLRFTLPPEPRFETHLASNPPRYWELDVRAEMPGIDYVGVFLLPVYARQA